MSVRICVYKYLVKSFSCVCSGTVQTSKVRSVKPFFCVYLGTVQTSKVRSVKLSLVYV